MKRKTSQSAIETHNLSSRQFPAGPGSDLGSTNAIPFHDLFIAVDKLAFCKDWEIDYLVDDHLYSVKFADDYGVNVFYPVMPKHTGCGSGLAKGFTAFDQVRQWIQERN